MITKTDMKRCKEILMQHQGKGNEISTKLIELDIYGKTEATHAQGRKLIKATVNYYKFNVCGGSKGYYVVTNSNEFRESVKGLKRRIDKTMDRIAYEKAIWEGGNRLCQR